MPDADDAESPLAGEAGDERAEDEAGPADADTDAAEVLAAALEAEAAQAAAAALEAEAAQAAAALVPAAAGTLAEAPNRARGDEDAEDDLDLVEDDFYKAEGQMSQADNAFRATCLVV